MIGDPSDVADLGQDPQDLGHRFLVGKPASGEELDPGRRNHALHEHVRVRRQRDVVLEDRAEPADRVERRGGELRVVAVEGDVDLDRRLGPAQDRVGEDDVR